MTGLLDGVTVLDLGQYISAPYCTKVLADMGASTIKVEPPAGDVARSMGPFPGDVPHPEKSGLFLALNANKDGITLNLHTVEGREILLRMAESADVIAENYPPDYLPSLRLGYEDLRKVNPRLILVSITAWGATGPRRDWAATDLTLFHAGGYGMQMREGAGQEYPNPPLRPGGHQLGYLAGCASLTAVATALFQRRRTGEGCHIDLSEFESVPGILLFGSVTESGFSDTPPLAERTRARRGFRTAILPCKDGYVAVSTREDAQWARWLEIMGNPAWAKEERFQTSQARIEHGEELLQIVSEWSRTQPKYDLYLAAQAGHIPCFPVNTTADLFSDRQLQHRGFFRELDHPVAGSLPYPTSAAHFSNATWEPEKPAPLLGQHNAEVLVRSLGYSLQDLPRLTAAGVL
jgi:crotonobetainyl-CoA:carnitine CoA-transferase CaiB-like acyl-CoA transferase